MHEQRNSMQITPKQELWVSLPYPPPTSCYTNHPPLCPYSDCILQLCIVLSVSVKEKLPLQDRWTYGWTNRVIPIYPSKLCMHVGNGYHNKMLTYVGNLWNAICWQGTGPDPPRILQWSCCGWRVLSLSRRYTCQARCYWHRYTNHMKDESYSPHMCADQNNE